MSVGDPLCLQLPGVMSNFHSGILAWAPGARQPLPRSRCLPHMGLTLRCGPWMPRTFLHVSYGLVVLREAHGPSVTCGKGCPPFSEEYLPIDPDYVLRIRRLEL